MTNAAALPYVCEATGTKPEDWKSVSVLETNGIFERVTDRRHFRHCSGMYVIAEQYWYDGPYKVLPQPCLTDANCNNRVPPPQADADLQLDEHVEQFNY